ncbi:MAG: hypothetical protein KDK28_21630 [Maritimibacter sp.]|nr:hypothetical protein [Maritimibacter sp.]
MKAATGDGSGGIGRVWAYLRAHWTGAQGLAWSFWVNLVAVRIVVFALHDLAVAELGPALADRRGLVLGLALVFHGGLFVWQAVGVIQAAEAHARSSGAMAPAWGAQLATALAFLWVLTYGLDAWQASAGRPDALAVQRETERARAARYSLTPADDGRSLVFAGSFELGATVRLAAALAAHPGVTEVVLDSAGGNIYAARGVSQLIRDRAVDTLVRAECSSACTVAFIGGTGRRLAPGGRLGFHQYRSDVGYDLLQSDPGGEQVRDRARFEAAGVAPWFLDRMFEATASQMWYPTPAELVAAGVVTEPVPGPGLVPGDGG